jgi:hypothetical protein
VTPCFAFTEDAMLRSLAFHDSRWAATAVLVVVVLPGSGFGEASVFARSVRPRRRHGHQTPLWSILGPVP